jgi:hypothetical protein
VRKKIAVAVVALGVVALGGTAALASSSSGGNTFLDDVARHLGIAPAKLQTAVNQAFADRLDRLVKEGKLTRAQADALEKRFKEHGSMPLLGPLGGPHMFRHHGFGRPAPFFHGGPMHGPGPAPIFGGLAKYLGITPRQLFDQLRSGKTLAAIAKAHGKSVSGLEKAMLAPVKKHLDAAVKAGHLTKSQEAKALKGISSHLDDFVTHGFRFHHDGDDGPAAKPGAKAPTAVFF